MPRCALRAFARLSELNATLDLLTTAIPRRKAAAAVEAGEIQLCRMFRVAAEGESDSCPACVHCKGSVVLQQRAVHPQAARIAGLCWSDAGLGSEYRCTQHGSARAWGSMVLAQAGTHGNTGGPMDWFTQLPKVTRSYAALCVFTAACVSWQISGIQHTFLDWRAVYSSLQVRTTRPSHPCELSLWL